MESDGESPQASDKPLEATALTNHSRECTANIRLLNEQVSQVVAIAKITRLDDYCFSGKSCVF